MSFAQETKNYLCTLNIKNKCCKESLLYGMMLFSLSFSKDKITTSTENAMTASLYSGMIKSLFGFEPDFSASARKGGEFSTNSYKLKISEELGSGRIFEYFGGDSSKINYEVFKCQSCIPLFVRGAFLVSGTAVDPEKSYSIDIRMPSKAIADAFYELMKKQGISVRIAMRGGRYIAFIRESESVQDFLTFIGAQHSALEMIDIKIYREIRNYENRVNNFDTANIYKTTESSRRQVLAVMKLEESGKLETLNEGLRLSARLRKENPFASLSDLVRLHLENDYTISRAGVEHRMHKLIRLSGIDNAPKFKK